MATSGILPDRAIEGLFRDGAVAAPQPLAVGQVQPASLDLRLGATAYRVRASFLPGAGNRISDKLDRLNLLVTGRDGRFSVPPVADSLQALRGHWLTAAGIARGGIAEPPASRVDAAELPPSEIA